MDEKLALQNDWRLSKSSSNMTLTTIGSWEILYQLPTSLWLVPEIPPRNHYVVARVKLNLREVDCLKTENRLLKAKLQNQKMEITLCRLFHLKQNELNPEKPVYLRGINKYMTKQNAVDLITSKFTDFKAVYQTTKELLKPFMNVILNCLKQFFRIIGLPILKWTRRLIP